MSGIFPLTGQLYIVMDIQLQNLLWSIVLIAAYSALYRNNPIFAIVEHCMIGTVAGQLLATNVLAIWNSIILLIPTDPGRIAVLIGGLALFSVFLGRRFTTLYRTVLSANIGAQLGVQSGASLTVTINTATTLANNVRTDLTNIIAISVTLIVVTYFLFSKAVDKRLGVFRRTARWVVFAYYAGFGASLFMTRLDNFSGWVYRMSGWPAILVPIAGFLIMLADSQIRKARARARPAEVKSPTTS